MTDERMQPADDAVTWEYRVPLLTSRFMLWDFARVIVLSVLTMYVLVAITGWIVEGEPVLLPPLVFLITGGIMVVMFALASLLLGNRFAMTFTVGPDGVRYVSGSRERKWNRAAIIVGALGGRPGVAGAGLLAASQEAGGWTWPELHAAREFPAQRVISVRNSWRTVLRLHCTPENWDRVRMLVTDGIAAGAAERLRAEALSVAATGSAVRPKRSWLSYLAAVVVPAAAAVLTTAWPWLAYEDGMRWVAVSALLLAAAGILGAGAGRLPALLSLAPTGYVVWLTAAEMLSTTAGWMPGEVRYGWQFDTGLLAVTVLGLATLVGLALWRLLGSERAGASD